MTINLEPINFAISPLFAAAAAATNAPALPNLNNLSNFTLVWVDVIIIIILGIGMFMGKRRGMSQELLPVLQWLMIVVLGARFYGVLAKLLSQSAGLSLLTANVICYIAIAVTIKIIFTVVKRAVGEKLVGSDIFGRMEYYFGMLAGMLRYFCVIMVVISIVNAKPVDAKQIAADKALQIKELGSTFFPTFEEIRQDILYKSLVGSNLRKHLADELITPTADGGSLSPVNRESGPARKKERAMDELMGNSPPKK